MNKIADRPTTSLTFIVLSIQKQCTNFINANINISYYSLRYSFSTRNDNLSKASNGSGRKCVTKAQYVLQTIWHLIFLPFCVFCFSTFFPHFLWSHCSSYCIRLFLNWNVLNNFLLQMHEKIVVKASNYFQRDDWDSKLKSRLSFWYCNW